MISHNFLCLLKKKICQFYNYFKLIFIKPEKNSNSNIMYATHLTRFITLLFDMIIIAYIALFVGYLISGIYNDFFTNYATVEQEMIIMNKFAVKTNLTHQEIIIAKKIFLRENIIKTLKLFFTIFLFLLFNYYYRNSPAKVLFRLSLVKESDYSQVSFKQIIKRYLYSFISIFVIFIGYFNCVWDRKCRAWHDKWTACVVVSKSSLNN